VIRQSRKLFIPGLCISCAFARGYLSLYLNFVPSCLCVESPLVRSSPSSPPCVLCGKSLLGSKVPGVLASFRNQNLCEMVRKQLLSAMIQGDISLNYCSHHNNAPQFGFLPDPENKSTFRYREHPIVEPVLPLC
jgi:hypothetical protein